MPYLESVLKNNRTSGGIEHVNIFTSSAEEGGLISKVICSSNIV